METHVERISNLQDIKKPNWIEKQVISFEDMTLGRRFEDKCQMYYQEKCLVSFNLCNGQETISTGVIGAMKEMIGFVVPIVIMSMH